MAQRGGGHLAGELRTIVRERLWQPQDRAVAGSPAGPYDSRVH